MNRLGLTMVSVVSIGLASMSLRAELAPRGDNGSGIVAQADNPPPRADGERPKPPRGEARPGADGQRPPRPDADGQRPPRADGDGQRQPGDGPRPPLAGPDGRRPGGPIGQMEVMKNFLDVVERYSKMSHDASSAGVAAVVTAADMMRSKGPEAGIEYFNRILPDVKNEAVRRTIRLQLVELYKASGKQDLALENLRQLMVDAPAATTAGADHKP